MLIEQLFFWRVAFIKYITNLFQRHFFDLIVSYIYVLKLNCFQLHFKLIR